MCALSLALEVSDGLCLAEPLSFVVIPLIAIIVLSIYLSIYLSTNVTIRNTHCSLFFFCFLLLLMIDSVRFMVLPPSIWMHAMPFLFDESGLGDENVGYEYRVG